MPSVVHPSTSDFPVFPAFAPVRRRSRGVCAISATPLPPLLAETGNRRSKMCSDGGSPGFADWKGGKADFIGIGPVHLEWTVVDGEQRWLDYRQSCLLASAAPCAKVSSLAQAMSE